ncbi:hypothetical protein chiPu_0002919 [Chiloscyllium punctatum]|uniref:Core Histone H2A/H2B/H3 domain-containing protein n=1 Tax=Chiloscyllium punctatum TaxID=137246 RepID=A0A401S2C3_CHIPU|nr:hypothetical protein [Chiloscyllium punctatum]
MKKLLHLDGSHHWDCICSQILFLESIGVVADEKKMQQTSTEGHKENHQKGTREEQEKVEKESYTSSIYKIIKLAHPDSSVSSKAMSTLNSFVSAIFKHIMGEASCLAHYNQFGGIQAAMLLLLPRQLAKCAMLEGTKVVTKCTNSK